MKFEVLTADLAALGLMLGVAAKIIPAVAGLLAVIYYGFVIFDRIRYGPELEKRMLWIRRRKREDNETNEA